MQSGACLVGTASKPACRGSIDLAGVGWGVCSGFGCFSFCPFFFCPETRSHVERTGLVPQAPIQAFIHCLQETVSVLPELVCLSVCLLGLSGRSRSWLFLQSICISPSTCTHADFFCWRRWRQTERERERRLQARLPGCSWRRAILRVFLVACICEVLWLLFMCVRHCIPMLVRLHECVRHVCALPVFLCLHSLAY